MSYEHDDDFLRIAAMILEGKKDPKGGDTAEKALAKVKKDVDNADVGQDKDNAAAQADDDKALSPEDGEGHDGDTSDHPDDPDQTGDAEPSKDKESGRELGKKKPKKLDLSKDPFKGEKPGDKKSDDQPEKGSAPGEKAKDEPSQDKPKFSDDKGPDGGDQGSDTDPKDGGEEDDQEGGDSGKMAGDNAHDVDDDSKSDASANGPDGADKGKKVGKEDPDGDHESDNESGESPGEVVDGSSESEVNLTPKIEDEELDEERAHNETRNELWGYHGQVYRHEGWEAAPKRYKAMHKRVGILTGGSPTKVRHYLDSKHGRHLHDAEVSGRADDKHIQRDFKDFSKGYKPEHFVEGKMTFVDKARAARDKMIALSEDRDDTRRIELSLDEGFPNSIPGEWYREGDTFHVAVMTEEGIRDFVFEKHIGFDKLKGELSHEKGVKNPGALAAYIGRKKYGAKKMAKAAASHKAL